jgi:predicted dehydrogenase
VPESFKPEVDSHLYLREAGAPHEKIHFADQELYLGEVEDLYDAAVYGKPQRVPLSDTRQNIATIRALLASAESGAPVKLE